MWAILPLGMKIALAGLDAMTLTWVRFLAATLFLASVLRASGNMPVIRGFTSQHWMLIAVAAFGLAGNYGLYALGLQYTNAGTAQVVIQIAPMLFTIGGIVFFGERFSAVQWTGFAVLVVGLAVFSSDQIAHMIKGLDRYYTGLGFIVVGAIAWAAYGLAQKQLLERMRSPQIMLLLYAAGTLVFLPMSAPAKLLAIDRIEVIAIVFCIVNMIVSYGTFAEALAHAEASRVSAVLAVTPLGTLAAVHAASVVNPVVFTPEPITHAGIAGAVLVVTGSLMTSLGRKAATEGASPQPVGREPVTGEP
jgi:drug/metabolite transporter (DMT)-like permease